MIKSRIVASATVLPGKMFLAHSEKEGEKKSFRIPVVDIQSADGKAPYMQHAVLFLGQQFLCLLFILLFDDISLIICEDEGCEREGDNHTEDAKERTPNGK